MSDQIPLHTPPIPMPCAGQDDKGSLAGTYSLTRPNPEWPSRIRTQMSTWAALVSPVSLRADQLWRNAGQNRQKTTSPLAQFEPLVLMPLPIPRRWSHPRLFMTLSLRLGPRDISSGFLSFWHCFLILCFYFEETLKIINISILWINWLTTQATDFLQPRVDLCLCRAKADAFTAPSRWSTSGWASAQPVRSLSSGTHNLTVPGKTKGPRYL